MGKRVGKITKKARQMKNIHSRPKYGDYGHKEGGPWPMLVTPGPINAFLLRMSLSFIRTIFFPVTLKTNNSRDGVEH